MSPSTNRSIGSIAYEENYPGQFEYLGERDVTRGRHSVEIVRGKGSLHPGSGNGVPQSIGPLILERISAERDQVHYAPAKRAMAPVPRVGIARLARGG